MVDDIEAVDGCSLKLVLPDVSFNLLPKSACVGEAETLRGPIRLTKSPTIHYGAPPLTSRSSADVRKAVSHKSNLTCVAVVLNGDFLEFVDEAMCSSSTVCVSVVPSAPRTRIRRDTGRRR